MREQLFAVSMNDRSGEKVKLMVWAANVSEATTKVVRAIGGPNGEYAWTGSGPVYENNEVVTRERKGE